MAVNESSPARRVEVRPFPASRRFVTRALRAGRRIAPIHGLISVDVTEARRRLESPQPSTAFLVASVGRLLLTTLKCTPIGTGGANSCSTTTWTLLCWWKFTHRKGRSPLPTWSVMPFRGT